MTDKEKKQGKREIQKFEYLEIEKSFLDEIKFKYKPCSITSKEIYKHTHTHTHMHTHTYIWYIYIDR